MTSELVIVIESNVCYVIRLTYSGSQINKTPQGD